jgi:predicted Rossmann fold flavoprotein
MYDLIIIGAGAAGLFAGASVPKSVNGLILEKGPAPGRKLLLSGGGQCNLTHGGSIKEYISHYGDKGGQIRSILYGYNNQKVMEFFRSLGMPLLERADGKVFPKSLKAKDVLQALLDGCKANGFSFRYGCKVQDVSFHREDCVYTILSDQGTYHTKKLIVATGGCSYPNTGSDGGFFLVLEQMGIKIRTTKPALVPIYVTAYPYAELAGISFLKVRVIILNGQNGGKLAEVCDSLLFAHTCFTGPAILNSSRYAAAGDEIIINYLPNQSADSLKRELTQIVQGNTKLILTVLYDWLNPDSTKTQAIFPKRFLEQLCFRAGVAPSQKASGVPGNAIRKMTGFLTADRFSISRLGGYNAAMVTTGGVSLDEVDLKTLESKKYPGLYFAGEVLDVDGDTGGYNLQFAFASGHLAANEKTPPSQSERPPLSI